MSVIFEENFPLLTPKTQEIWKVLHYFCKEFITAFPSHDKIAKLAGCSRRTVINAIEKFKNFGWIEYYKRCYRSNVYVIPRHLLQKNPKDSNLYKKNEKSYEQGEGGVFRDKCTQICTLSRVSNTNTNTVRTNVHQINSQKYENRQKVSEDLLQMPFTREQKLEIQRNFRPHVIRLALESYKTYKFSKKRPIAIMFYLLGKENAYWKQHVGKII